MGPSRPLFIYFRLFNTLDIKQMFNKILPKTGVEPRTSGNVIDSSTNWATTTSQVCILPLNFKITIDRFCYSQTIALGSDCGSVGRTIASETRGLQFESSHRQKLLILNICILSTVFGKDKNKEKESGNGPFFNNKNSNCLTSA